MALYHKHRPQTFKEVIGQENIVKTITNQLKNNRLAHAYLFSGARGLGKTTTARLLAKAVNCCHKKKNDIEPCNDCEICNEISKSSSIDVIEIDAASHTGVDNVRDNIIENAQFRPTKSKYKIFIIDEAHMLSIPAFNALLKILEEPPTYVIFILATTEYHKLPETIISRCQRFNFKKVSFDAMKKQLQHIAKQEGIKIDNEIVERIINKSDGCVRDAVSLLDQIMATGEKNITSNIASIVLPTSNFDEIIEFLEMLIEIDTPGALKKINRLADEGLDMKQFVYDIIEILRLMLISKNQIKLTSAGLDISNDAEKRVLKLNKKLESFEIIKLIDLLIKRAAEIKMHTISQLPIELAIVEWQIGNKQRTTNNEQNNDPPSHKADFTERADEDKHEKKSIKDRVKEMVCKERTLTMEEVKEKWNDFMAIIEKQSASLSFILKTATLNEINNNIITIGVNFGIHKDRLVSSESRKNIEQMLHDNYKTKLRIDVTVNEGDATRNAIDQELQDLTSAFGGEVVN